MPRWTATLQLLGPIRVSVAWPGRGESNHLFEQENRAYDPGSGESAVLRGPRLGVWRGRPQAPYEELVYPGPETEAVLPTGLGLGARFLRGSASAAVLDACVAATPLTPFSMDLDPIAKLLCSQSRGTGPITLIKLNRIPLENK